MSISKNIRKFELAAMLTDSWPPCSRGAYIHTETESAVVCGLCWMFCGEHFASLKFNHLMHDSTSWR
jgi:Pyruvate/2-oxoacid:ferredoxin oxidoreductase delta subunit